MSDMVNHPPHYKARVPGIECIQVTEHFPFNEGNAIKYIWRAGLKGEGVEAAVEDFEKAKWYIDRAIQKMRRDEMIRRSQVKPIHGA